MPWTPRCRLTNGESRVALGPELADGGIEVDGRPQNDAVEHEAEAAELVLQAALVPVVQLALLPVADLPGQRVAALLQVADALDVAPVGLVGVDVAEDVQRLEDRPYIAIASPSAVGCPSRCSIVTTSKARTVPV
jgi:hypothetical protein